MLNVIYIYFLQSLNRFSMEQYHFVIYIKNKVKAVIYQKLGLSLHL